MMIDDETFKTQVVVFAWAFFIESSIFKIAFVELEDEPGWDAMIFASFFCAIAISLAAYIDSIMERKSELMTDNIDPEHYRPHGIINEEPIDVMKKMLTQDAYRGFLVGNILKYVSRYDLKNGIEDLEKAKKYIDFLEDDIKSQ